MLLLLLFYEFAKVSIFCVGGGYASMPLIQAAIVNTHHWLSMSEFIDVFTISQMTPGPIGINAATFVGMKTAGVVGAICATAGFVVPSLVICIIVANLFFKYGDIGPIRGVLNGLRPAVVALIMGAAISFVTLSLFDTEKLSDVVMNKFDPSSVVILILALIALQYKYGVITILLACGALGLLFGLLGV